MITSGAYYIVNLISINSKKTERGENLIPGGMSHSIWECGVEIFTLLQMVPATLMET